MSVAPDAVRTAACELFARQGYRGTSMKDIGGALAVSAPNLYNHVPNKQDLLVVIMDTAMDRALSLKVTSTMVGALQLAALAETMEALLCGGDWAAAEPLLEVLAPAVAAVRTAGGAVVNGLLHP